MLCILKYEISIIPQTKLCRIDPFIMTQYAKCVVWPAMVLRQHTKHTIRDISLRRYMHYIRYPQLYRMRHHCHSMCNAAMRISIDTHTHKFHNTIGCISADNSDFGYAI